MKTDGFEPRKKTDVRGVLRATVRGLLVPRCALPIVVVVVPLTIIQDAYSADPIAVPLALLMSATFLFVGPFLWRILLPMDRAFDASSVLRVLLYAAVSASLVLGIGVGLPGIVGAGRTFLTSKPSLALTSFS